MAAWTEGGSGVGGQANPQSHPPPSGLLADAEGGGSGGGGGGKAGKQGGSHAPLSSTSGQGDDLRSRVAGMLQKERKDGGQ
jgi:hypothetical protein